MIVGGGLLSGLAFTVWFYWTWFRMHLPLCLGGLRFEEEEETEEEAVEVAAVPALRHAAYVKASVR